MVHRLPHASKLCCYIRVMHKSVRVRFKLRRKFALRRAHRRDAPKAGAIVGACAICPPTTPSIRAPAPQLDAQINGCTQLPRRIKLPSGRWQMTSDMQRARHHRRIHPRAPFASPYLHPPTRRLVYEGTNFLPREPGMRKSGLWNAATTGAKRAQVQVVQTAPPSA